MYRYLFCTRSPPRAPPPFLPFLSFSLDEIRPDCARAGALMTHLLFSGGGGIVRQSLLGSVVDPHWFHQCGTGNGSGSSIFLSVRIQIQGFDDQNLGKIYSWNIFFIKNCYLLIPRPPQRTSKLQEKSSSLKREHLATKFELSSFLWVILTLLDPDPYSQCWSGSSQPKWMRIRIHNTASRCSLLVIIWYSKCHSVPRNST